MAENPSTVLSYTIVVGGIQRTIELKNTNFCSAMYQNTLANNGVLSSEEFDEVISFLKAEGCVIPTNA